MRLASAHAPCWDTRGKISEGRQWLEAALALASDAVTKARADALAEAGLMAFRQTDFGQAVVWANAVRVLV